MRKHVDTEDKTTVAICDTGSNYKNPQKALRDHVDEEDKTLNESFTVNGTHPILIDESGLSAQRRSSLLALLAKNRPYCALKLLIISRT